LQHLAKLTTLLLLAALPCCAQTAATVTVNPSAVGPPVTNQILGVNMANWFDQTLPGMATALKSAGIRATRWPGGAQADTFHWQTNTECNNGWASPNATFDIFNADIVKPAGLDLAVAVNYGSNETCTGGGDPTEAAGWVTYAKTHGDPVSHWTVGNEVYGSGEYDLHPIPHDAQTYATAVATGYYPDMKAANPNAQIGVVVQPGQNPPWDPVVLTQAPYDFVEYHYYPQLPGQESDTYLLTQAPQDFTTQINALQADLQSAGHAGTPIYIGEAGSVSYNPGKQTSSITQALYAGEMLGEMMNDGISRATWWLGFGGCSDATTGNFSSSLYGWQNFGGYAIFSDGLPEYSCPGAPSIPLGTMLPTARAFQLFSLVALNGENALGVTLAGNSTLLRAYAATHQGGVAVVLFNLNQTATLPVSIAVPGVTTTSSVTTTTYDRAIYDQSQNNVWAPPTQTRSGAASLPLSITLQPWSMTVLRLAP
jgi:hypothetical protein